MIWRKVKSGSKPFMWWYHKIMCEIGYSFFGSTSNTYYKHLHIMCDKYGFNLYGEKSSYKK